MTTWGTRSITPRDVPLLGGTIWDKPPDPKQEETDPPTSWVKADPPSILPTPKPPVLPPDLPPQIYDIPVEVPTHVKQTGISLVPKTIPNVNQPTLSIVDKLRGVKDKLIDFVTTPVQDGKRYRVICKLTGSKEKFLTIRGKGFTFAGTRVEISEVGEINNDVYFVARFRRVQK